MRGVVVYGLVAVFACSTVQADSPVERPAMQAFLQLVHGEPLGCAPGYLSVDYEAGQRCERMFSDGGRVCTAADQCQGYCLADWVGNGACSATPLGSGCYDVIVGNGQTARLCVD